MISATRAEWTSDAPHEAGLYWLMEGEALPRIVMASAALPGGRPDHVAFIGASSEKAIRTLRGARWSGPLLPPSEG
jgi:hypothetical protein